MTTLVFILIAKLQTVFNIQVGKINTKTAFFNMLAKNEVLSFYKGAIFNYFCKKNKMKGQAIVAKEIHVNGVNCVRYELIEKSAETSFFHISDIHSAIKTNYETLQKGMHCHTFFSVLWFFSGEGIHIVDSDKYKIEENTIFFLSPNNFTHVATLKI